MRGKRRASDWSDMEGVIANHLYTMEYIYIHWDSMEYICILKQLRILCGGLNGLKRSPKRTTMRAWISKDQTVRYRVNYSLYRRNRRVYCTVQLFISLSVLFIVMQHAHDMTRCTCMRRRMLIGSYSWKDSRFTISWVKQLTPSLLPISEKVVHIAMYRWFFGLESNSTTPGLLAK